MGERRSSLHRALDAASGIVEAAAEARAGGPPVDTGTTGVVFVHGIGSQKSGETLLQWSTPIVEALTRWHAHARDAGIVADDIYPPDPVASAEIDFESTLPVVSLRVPACTAGGVEHAEQQWVMTEAWWASKVSAPSLATMTSWLGPQGGAAQIVSAILGNRAEGGGWLSASKAALVPFVAVLSALVLTGFALLRTITQLIPIASIRDAAILRAFDEFLTGWFGDVRILLYDPVQSANIRSGLAGAIRGLREYGCGRIVIVAHSGGVMVSYLMLTDPEFAGVWVDKLVTIGEGWNLATTLYRAPSTPDGLPIRDRLRRSFLDLHPNLRWRDFWATHDPAAAGPVREDRMARHPGPDHLRTTPVWNRRSLLDDHGTYWDNDEEFVIPLLRELDVPLGWGTGSRFYPADPAAPGVAPTAPLAAASAPPFAADLEPGPRADRHRERVGVLALWRQACIALAVVTIGIDLAWRPAELVAFGRSTLEVLAAIPGVTALAPVVDWLFGLRPQDWLAVGGVRLGGLIEPCGIAVLQAVVIVSVLQLLSAPVRSYEAWPRGATMGRVVALVETALAVLLGITVAVIVVRPHTTLLGAGWQDWLWGFALSILVIAAGLFGSTWTWLRTPFGQRLYGIGAAAVFVTALVCAVLAIFERADLAYAELGYVAIWGVFFVIYRAGVWRWQHWDQVERGIAYGLVGTVHVNRWPAIVGSLGFLGLAATTIAVFLGIVPVIPGLVAGAVLAAVALVVALVAATMSTDSVGSPGAVESARRSA